MKSKKSHPTDKTHLPRTEAAIRAYTETGDKTDPLGMWTGRPRMGEGTLPHPMQQGEAERPVQDADDL